MSSEAVPVVPLRRFPRIKGVFDYGIPQGMAVAAGDLVEVPFRNQPTAALVVSQGADRRYTKELKFISRLLVPSAVSAPQLRLVSWLAQFSGVSLATVARLTVTAVPPRESSAPVSLKRAPAKPGKQRPWHLVSLSAAQRERVISLLVARVVKRKQQALLLVPEVPLISPWLKKFALTYEVAAFSGRGQLSDLRATWLDTRSGRTQLIIGTRSALWLNFHNLGGIIIDQAENENYLQAEQNPRYDAIRVAHYLADLWAASLAQVSVAPRLESWLAASLGQAQWRELSSKTPTIKIVNLSHQPASKRNLISAELKQAIDLVLSNHKKVLLYLNRRGRASAATCQDCGFVATCTQCQRKMVLINNGQALTCYHCGLTQALTIPCPSCGSVQVIYSGGGTARLAAEAAKLWPRHKLCLVEGEFKSAHAAAAARANLIVGSRSAVRAVNGQPLGLSALIAVDTELSLPEFRSAERVWQLIRGLMVQSEKIFIQTHNPEHYLWSSLAAKDIGFFYKTELALRRQYSYPPIINLVRFSCSHDTESAAKDQAEELKLRLSPHLPQGVEMIGPYPDYWRQRGQQWRWHLLLKLQLDYDPSKLWPLIPADVTIERDPWLILS